jgi:hypothetical protein
MGRRWHEVLEMKASAWNVPQTEVTGLAGLVSSATDRLEMAKTSDRSAVITAQCKEVFDVLIAKMRFIKSRYFLQPPLSNADFTLLQLTPHDSVKTAVPIPVDHAGIEITKWALHSLGFRYFVATDMGGHDSNHGVRVYYGLVAPGTPVATGNPSSKRLAGNFHILSEAPQTPADLPDSFFTRREHDRLEFPPEASGKTCYLAARYENGKGQSGPWGTMISAVVP